MLHAVGCFWASAFHIVLFFFFGLGYFGYQHNLSCILNAYIYISLIESSSDMKTTSTNWLLRAGDSVSISRDQLFQRDRLPFYPDSTMYCITLRGCQISVFQLQQGMWDELCSSSLVPAPSVLVITARISRLTSQLYRWVQTWCLGTAALSARRSRFNYFEISQRL